MSCRSSVASYFPECPRLMTWSEDGDSSLIRSTSTETEFSIQHPLDPAWFAQGDVLDVFAMGDVRVNTNGGADTVTYRFKVGDTLFTTLNTLPVNTPGVTTTNQFVFRWRINVRTAGTSPVWQVSRPYFLFETEGFQSDISTESKTFGLSSNDKLVISAQFSVANNLNNTRLKAFQIVKYPQTQ